MMCLLVQGAGQDMTTPLAVLTVLNALTTGVETSLELL